MGMATRVLQFLTVYDFNLECLLTKDFSSGYEGSKITNIFFSIARNCILKTTLGGLILFPFLVLL